MRERELLQYLVLLFDPAGTAVQQELALAEFQPIRSGAAALPQHAGRSVRAAYVVVEPGLRIGALVFFVLPLDAVGKVPESFNLPLEYLAEFAGIRDDLGIGPVRVASRGQCPVPWLALKLWEPVAGGEDGTARAAQRAVRLNRLRLDSNPARLLPNVDPAPTNATSRDQAESPPGWPDVGSGGQWPAAAAWGVGLPGGSANASAVARILADAVAEPVVRPVAATLPVQREMPAAVVDQGQQEQIRKLRSEVQELRAALRSEVERNRRLQELLRGDF
jgi:hypothetical protein